MHSYLASGCCMCLRPYILDTPELADLMCQHHHLAPPTTHTTSHAPTPCAHNTHELSGLRLPPSPTRTHLCLFVPMREHTPTLEVDEHVQHVHNACQTCMHTNQTQHVAYGSIWTGGAPLRHRTQATMLSLLLLLRLPLLSQKLFIPGIQDTQQWGTQTAVSACANALRLA